MPESERWVRRIPLKWVRGIPDRIPHRSPGASGSSGILQIGSSCANSSYTCLNNRESNHIYSYGAMIYINPDDFLGSPRIFTPERNRDAWSAVYDRIEKSLSEAKECGNFYLVCGVQGAGKTRWVKENRDLFK